MTNIYTTYTFHQKQFNNSNTFKHAFKTLVVTNVFKYITLFNPYGRNMLNGVFHLYFGAQITLAISRRYLISAAFHFTSYSFLLDIWGTQETSKVIITTRASADFCIGSVMHRKIVTLNSHMIPLCFPRFEYCYQLSPDTLLYIDILICIIWVTWNMPKMYA